MRKYGKSYNCILLNYQENASELADFISLDLKDIAIFRENIDNLTK